MIWLWLIYRFYFLSAFCLMLKALTSKRQFEIQFMSKAYPQHEQVWPLHKSFLHYSSHLRHIHLEDMKFGPGKCSHNLCICYLYWRDISIQGKGAISLSPEHGHLIALKRWLTTKIVDNFKSSPDTMATAFKARTVSRKSRCIALPCGNSTHNIAGMI